MYLKSIEIQGFKSFAHKTLLQFNNGVTAIVGPNGSGKSNIADAVRWVLGEQKVKQLRGTAMQDVIFAGTALRKAQGFASVSITIDNTDHSLPVDYAEVTVARRLFRSGESEYMINGQSVRLRDVQELFYDTGIGKEGYSIIGQGQIDAILNGRPEDRRGLFDEAAGIVKFKRRKQMALKKLENEQANLQRVTDILDELGKRVRPLEKQSATAREYLKLRDEQKLLDLNLFIRETGSLVEGLQKTRESLEIVKASLEDTNRENEELRQKSSALMETLGSLDEEINKKKDDKNRAELAIQNLNGQIQVSEAELHAEEQTIERCEEQLGRVQQEITENRGNVDEYLASLRELKESLRLIDRDTLAQQGVEFQEMETLEARVESFILQLQPYAAENPESGSETEETGQAEESARAERQGENETSEEEDFAYREPEWLRAIRHKKDDLAEIREKSEKTQAWLNRSTAEYNSLTSQQKELQLQLSEAQRQFSAEFARFDSLKNLAERYEGFGDSVKALMKERQKIPGIRGVVADLVRTEKKYETAVETALGGRIQNIVTETEAAAKSGIEFLKRTRQGRATFLPMDAVRPKDNPEYRQALHEPGVIGLGSDIAETDAEYQDLVRYLLGSVLVADNMDHALAIARKYRHNLRIVTLEGELLAPGGSISGGAYRSSSNLIGRSRELEDMKDVLRKLRSGLEKLKEQEHGLEKLITDKSEEIDRLREELKSIEEEKNKLSFGILSDMKLKYSQLQQRTDFIEENVLRIGSAMERSSEEQKRLEGQMQESRTKIESARQNIRDRKGDIEHISNVLAKLADEIAAELARREAVAGSQSGYVNRRDELNGEILELQKEELRLENQLEKDQSRLDKETDYIWEEYELSLSSAREFYDENLGGITKIRSRLQAVRAGIKALGPVNVQAIEEYKEVSQRYEFLSAQHRDLTESRDSILGIVTELDEGMKKQFDTQFAAIKTQFTEVFRELFGGGEADLSLVTDPDEGIDELEAGIAIHVQPPGKKLQNIVQLSGGEKALTAIALLFAIQNLKPSPFCLLDEIEAALDDSNVIRFATYLHKLTERTQFIVITHRRGTMESADRLYGVTMQEKGITKLVSVDLVSDQLN